MQCSPPDSNAPPNENQANPAIYYGEGFFFMLYYFQVILVIKEIIKENLEKYKNDIDSIKENKIIDCITIFSSSEEDYDALNEELRIIN